MPSSPFGNLNDKYDALFAEELELLRRLLQSDQQHSPGYRECSMSERYEQARATVVEAVKEFIVAGSEAGRTELEIQADFMVAFSQAMVQEETHA